MRTETQPTRTAREVNGSHLARWWWVLPLGAVVAFAALRPSVTERLEDPDRPERDEIAAVERPETATLTPPTVGGVRLPIVEPADTPPAPVAWAHPGVPVPFGQWWSGLESGASAPALWAKPLLLRINDDGRADLSVPVLATQPDGTRDSRVTPAVFFEFGGPPTVEIVDQGAFHVRFTLSSSDVDVTFTLVEGSPYLEIEGDGTLELSVPALEPIDGRSTFTPLSTAAGRWFFASSESTALTGGGAELLIDLEPGVRHAVGALPADADAEYEAAVRAAISSPLVDTTELLTVADNGTVRQELSVVRADPGETVGVWSLLPHHVDFIAGNDRPAGSISAAHGRSPLVVGSSITLEYPAVPIVWQATPPVEDGGASFDETIFSETIELPDASGSYFGAKNVATHALLHEVLVASGSADAADAHLASALDSLAQLVTPGGALDLVWEPRWGSVVVTPAEFGVGDQLNDHHLQYGYWVAAASSVVVADPKQRVLLQDTVDLLIADYAGAALVPGLDGFVSDEGVWSAYAGHSWASGVGGFGAGNNLESISESSHAWWAAAKWFLATDRPELAEPFIARLTIESWLTGYEWLPTPARQSPDTTVRPWTGVVWSGKTDAGTWFSAADEAALGIRLIPVGPQSFSRYPDLDAVRAAQTRWSWCETRGGGCTQLWSNLLDTDAAVAGRASVDAGPEPEPTTTETVRRWWRQHWETTELAPGWQCEAGAMVRRRFDGALIAHVTNPSSRPVALGCVSPNGDRVDLAVGSRASVTVPISA